MPAESFKLPAALQTTSASMHTPSLCTRSLLMGSSEQKDTSPQCACVDDLATFEVTHQQNVHIVSRFPVVSTGFWFRETWNLGTSEPTK